MFKKIFINIFAIILVIFLCDFFLYIYDYKHNYAKLPFQYDFGQFEKQFNDIKNYFNGKDNIGASGRLPQGLEYKDKSKHSIVIFGCSFAFGQYLNANQTFDAKLVKLLKLPVYNRAISGGSFQHMYKQSTSYSFYKSIPYADTVIYVMINDHYRRMFGLPFSIYDDVNYLHYYKNKNNEFILKNNCFLNFIQSMYIYRIIRAMVINSYIKNEKNANDLTDTAVQYFIQTRDNLEKQYKNKINFFIFYYDDIPYENLLTKKLKQNNINVISYKELTKENLNSNQYKMQENGHPNEAAWNLLTPLLAKRIILNK